MMERLMIRMTDEEVSQKLNVLCTAKEREVRDEKRKNATNEVS